MAINALSGEATQAQPLNTEKKATENKQKDVSFWSSDWNAGNLVRETIGWDTLANWLDDSDKACTDGQDDGKLGIGETLEHLGKGVAGIVKGFMNHPIATGVTIAAGVGATIATGGAILPVLAAAGGTLGAGMVGVGAYKAATADTDAEAKQAFETIGNGVFALGASVASAKPALDVASKAGVTSAKIAKDMNTAEAFVQTFKATPEALKMSGVNVKANTLTWATGNVQPNSNAGRIAEREAIIAQTKALEEANIARIQRDPQAAAKELTKNGICWFDDVDNKAINDVVNHSGVKYQFNRDLGELHTDRGDVFAVEYTVTRGDKTLNIGVADNGGDSSIKHLYFRIIEALSEGNL